MKKIKKKRKPIRKKATKKQPSKSVQDSDLDVSMETLLNKEEIEARFSDDPPEPIDLADLEHDDEYSSNLIKNSTGWNAFGIPNYNPKIEMRGKSDASIDLTDSIIEDTTRAVLLTVEKDIDGKLGDFSTIFDHDSNMKILFRNLTRVILNIQDTGLCSVTFAYADEGQTECFIDLVYGGETAIKLYLALDAIAEIIADLIVKDGIVYPEEAVQKRIFDFKGVLNLMSLLEYRMWKGLWINTKKTRLSLEELDAAFKEYRAILGRDFRHKDYKKLDKEQSLKLRSLMLQALFYGKRQWPFDPSEW